MNLRQKWFSKWVTLMEFLIGVTDESIAFTFSNTYMFIIILKYMYVLVDGGRVIYFYLKMTEEVTYYNERAISFKLLL